VKEEALAFKMVYNMWILSDLKIFLGNSEVDAAAVLLRIRITPWINEKTVV
jgi:hypothetical protein